MAVIAACFFYLSPSALVCAQHGDEQNIVTLAPMVVTAEQILEYVKNHPQNVVILDQQEIKERNFLGLGEALDAMPGVEVRRRGGGMGTKILIRGGGGSGPVSVLVDGRAINSSQYGGVDLNSIPIETIKRVYVFKPPVPVWLGPGSAAGAVNIITTSSLSNGPEKKSKGRIKANGGSYGAVDLSVTLLSPQENGNTRVTAGAGHKDGKRPNTDRDNGNFSFNWNRETSPQARYNLNGRYYHTEHGSPGPIDNPTPNARQRYQKGSLDFLVEGLIGEMCEYSLKSYGDVENLKDRSETGELSTLRVYKVGINCEGVWSNDEESPFRLGGLIERNSVDHQLTGDHHREKVSLHVQHDRALSDFTLSLGLRGEHTNDFGYQPALRAGLSYSFSEKTLLKTNAGYSVEIPTFNQLYQPSHGSIDQVRGNPDLEEQDIYSYDLGLEHSFSRNTILNATLFRTDTRDFITYIRGEDLVYSPVNISRARKQGMEMSLNLRLLEDILLEFDYVYLDTENRDTDYELQYSPKHNVKVTGKFMIPTRTKIEAMFKAVSHRYSSPGTARAKKLDAYCLVNLKVIHPVLIKSLPCDLFIHIDNLFDTGFEAHAGYPDDGLRFVAGMNMNF